MEQQNNQGPPPVAPNLGSTVVTNADRQRDTYSSSEKLDSSRSSSRNTI
jgi:hypothetical protein